MDPRKIVDLTLPEDGRALMRLSDEELDAHLRSLGFDPDAISTELTKVAEQAIAARAEVQAGKKPRHSAVAKILHLPTVGRAVKVWLPAAVALAASVLLFLGTNSIRLGARPTTLTQVKVAGKGVAINASETVAARAYDRAVPRTAGGEGYLLWGITKAVSVAAECVRNQNPPASRKVYQGFLENSGFLVNSQDRSINVQEKAWSFVKGENLDRKKFDDCYADQYEATMLEERLRDRLAQEHAAELMASAPVRADDPLAAGDADLHLEGGSAHD
jgi:hypothetical protein